MNELQVKEIDKIFEEVVAWRRHLHQFPELSFQEKQTSQFVYDTLLSFGGVEVSRPTEFSVMARLIGGKPGKVLGIRADMDALPINEETNLSFSSKTSGVMHACGHDGHTAMLLGTVKLLLSMQDQIKGEVRFLFQHAEEYFPGGAVEMVAAGVLEGVDTVIAAHVISTMEVGTFGVSYGPAMAAPDGFFLTIQGQGGHGGSPHTTVDSITVGAQIVSNLQHIVSRNIDPLDPLVVSIGKFVAGEAANVIADTVEISGTVRHFDKKYRETIPVLMERIIKGITDAHGATYNFEYLTGYDPVINDHATTEVIERILVDLYGKENFQKLKPAMSAEDFSAFTQTTPGSYFFIGAGNKEKGITYPHHHPKFDFDEQAMKYAMEIFVNAVFTINN